MGRQTEILQTLVLFLQQTIYTEIRVYIPKGIRHLLHTAVTEVSFPSAAGPYCHSGFFLSDSKNQGVDINVYLTFYVSI